MLVFDGADGIWQEVIVGGFFSQAEAQSVTTITASADNYLKNDNKTQNRGALDPLKMNQASQSRLLVRVNQADILSALNGRPLVSARLELHIDANWGGWTTAGRRVEVYRMTPSEPSSPAGNCSVSAINFLDFTGPWRKFSVKTTGCCSYTCNPQHFYALQYFIDGQNQSSGCADLAGQTSTASWTFLPNVTHTIGARVVEYQSLVIGGKRRRVCTGYSPIKNSPGFVPTVASGDSDSDSIKNSVENSFIGSYAPFVRLNLFYAAPADGLPIALTVRVGPINLKKAAPQTDIFMNYNYLWTFDRGCPAGEGDHDYDTEPMGYLLQGGLKPSDSAGWTVTKTITAAHEGTSAENVDMTNGFQSETFSAYSKHGLFLRVCNYFCNHCDSNGPIPQLTPDNVGNGPNYPAGLCPHPEHWTNGNYKVPEKWERVPKKLSTFYTSPFPAQ